MFFYRGKFLFLLDFFPFYLFVRKGFYAFYLLSLLSVKVFIRLFFCLFVKKNWRLTYLCAHYNLLLVLASSRILPSHFRSTWSGRRFPSGFVCSSSFRGTRSSSIRCTWPIRLIRLILMYLTMSGLTMSFSLSIFFFRSSFRCVWIGILIWLV